MNIVHGVQHSEIQQSAAVDVDSGFEGVVRACQLGDSKSAEVLVLRRRVAIALVDGKPDGIASLDTVQKLGSVMQ